MVPTPEQRIRFTLPSSAWTTSGNDWLDLVPNAPIYIGSSRSVPGKMHFTIKYPDTHASEDFMPMKSNDTLKLEAAQLGVEQHLGQYGSFSAPYSLTTTRALLAQFPIGNNNGLAGLRSLAPGESSLLTFDIYNCSRKPFGHAHAGRRHVAVAVSLTGEAQQQQSSKVPLELLQQVVLVGPDGVEYRPACDSGNVHLRKAHGGVILRGSIFSLDSVLADSTTVLRCTLRLPASLPPPLCLDLPYCPLLVRSQQLGTYLARGSASSNGGEL
jgi:hypothetical protein